MSTITKESIADTIEGLEHLANSGIQSVYIDMAIAGMRRLLASLEAEPGVNHQPVAWQYKEYVHVRGLGYLWLEKLDCEFPGADCETLQDVVPLYIAPPAPVSVPAAMEMDDDFDSAFEHGKAVGWNAYRAAMLQGADGALANEDTKRVGELVMWVKRLAHSLRKANPDSKLQSDAMDYLSRKGLIGVEDILR